MEVCWFDDVAVGDGDCSDACACEPFGGGCSECAAADDEDVGAGESLLTLLADVCEQGLAVIAVVDRGWFVGKVWHWSRVGRLV